MNSRAAEKKLVNVRGTELLAGDTREQYREKIARITLDSMVQFVGLLDAEGTVLEINHVALDAVGIKLSDVEGKPFWTTFWWQVSEEINQGLRDSIRRAAHGEFVRWDTEIYGRSGGKETIVIDASLMPVRHAQGKVVFITAEGRDITAKKAYEREIASKNQDLQVLLERVSELDEIKTQFFANVSHELRTPLQLIIGPADRLSKDLAMSSQQREESARVIGRNARMLLKHVNDLLDISKFEAGKLKIDLRETDVASLLRLTASNFDVLAVDRKISFLVDAARDFVCAIDAEKIQRVMMNLLSNAFKFVPDGGKVQATLCDSARELMVSVEDSGPGVKPELRKAIFERFRQGEGGMSRQFGGTCLGLAIAKEFVEMHHGTLEVADSNLGGACFRMTLPLSRGAVLPTARNLTADFLDPTIVEGFIEELKPAKKRRDEKQTETYFPGKKVTVLVVEDNPEMNQFVVESLASEFHVVTAFDGREGLQKALELHPALIVTDIMMPGMSGDQMVAEIRKCSELAGVSILLLSAKADEELKIKLLDGGAQDFVAKPFSEKDLQVRVRNLVELRKTQERYRTLFRSMDEGFCSVEVIFDESGKAVDYRFLETNDAFEKQTGLKEACGKLMRDLAPNHEKHWFEIYGKIALTGEPARFENCAVALGRWYDVYAFRVGRPENRQVAIFFNDITERKRIQISLEDAKQELANANERLAKTNEELELRVEKRTASLSDAIAQMEEFWYTVSHDLRAPLRGMQAYSEALLEEHSELLASRPEAIEFLRRISENANRLDKMVRDVLMFSRSARSELRIERVSLNRLVRGLVEHYPAMHPPHAEIHIETLADVLGHETSLIQAISNLLTNAVKFVAPGTIPKIRVWTERRDQDVRIWIEDNGIGIAPKLQHRLFRMFERINPGLSYEGTGVGLAVVRKAAERMNGKVGVESDGVNGCRFWIQLRGAQ